MFGVEVLMSVNLKSKDFILGVIGAGAMGRGIAQVAITGGLRVKLYDIDNTQSVDAIRFIAKMLNRATEKGQLTLEEAAAANKRLIAPIVFVIICLILISSHVCLVY